MNLNKFMNMQTLSIHKKLIVAEKKTKDWSKGKTVDFSNDIKDFGNCVKCGKKLEKKHYSKKPICFDCLMEKQRDYSRRYNQKKREGLKKVVKSSSKKCKTVLTI
mgnify:CR=1 FL=1